MGQTITQKYASAGHPSIKELKISARHDSDGPRDLIGDFWPEEENIDNFLLALREWRGHTQSHQAA